MQCQTIIQRIYLDLYEVTNYTLRGELENRYICWLRSKCNFALCVRNSHRFVRPCLARITINILTYSLYHDLNEMKERLGIILDTISVRNQYLIIAYMKRVAFESGELKYSQN